MKYLFRLTFVLFSAYGCDSKSIGIEKYNLDCPKISSLAEFSNREDSYSINIPSAWSKQIMNPIDSTEISTFIFSDSTFTLNENDYFIRFQTLGVTKYIGTHKDVTAEYKSSLAKFVNSNANVKIQAKGSTDLLRYPAYFIDMQEETEMGLSNSIMFLMKDENSEYEYFVLNSAVYGEYDSDFELCQMSNILKSFRILSNPK